MTKSIIFSTNVNGYFGIQQAPGANFLPPGQVGNAGSDYQHIFSEIYQMPPDAFPVQYPDGNYGIDATFQQDEPNEVEDIIKMIAEKLHLYHNYHQGIEPEMHQEAFDKFRKKYVDNRNQHFRTDDNGSKLAPGACCIPK